MNELHLFAGAGGGILGGMLLGHRTVCAVEIEPYCRKVLLQRQRDGILPWFPIWDDVRTFDGKPWRGIADVVCGGFPCQDISASAQGSKHGARGIDGPKSGLWHEMSRVISEVRPVYTFIENSPMLTFRGLERIICDLAKLGYDCRWGIIGANNTGAPHKRTRIWILSYSKGRGLEKWMPEKAIQHYVERRIIPPEWDTSNWEQTGETPTIKPLLDRNADGMADRVERIKAIGNGQVPAVVACAWRTLMDA